MKTGVKHLIECHCVLPQYRSNPNPPFHKFVVFSVINHRDNVIPKCVQCNNCGVIHKVVDLTSSEVALGNDNIAAVVSIDDIRHSLPENVVKVLENYKCDIATWEETLFNFENEKWGSRVILSNERTENEVRGKYMIINGSSSIKIESYSSKLSFI